MRAVLDQYTRPHVGKAVWQMINTIVPYLGIMALMTYSVVQGWPYLVTLALALPASAFAARIFISGRALQSSLK